MNEKINFNDSNVLIVCPSNDWGTIERRAFKDAQYLRDMGGNPTIFCLKGSFLEQKAKQEVIECIYYQGQQLSRAIDLKYYLDMVTILKQNRYDLVHCYQLKYIWMIALAMKKYSLSPLFLTLNEKFQVSYKSFIYKWFIKRVDRVFTLSHPGLYMIPIFLPIHRRKIRFSGVGVESFVEKLGDDNEELKLTTIVTNTNLKQVEEFIQTIIKLLRSKSLKLFMYYDAQVDNQEAVKKLKNIIIGLGVGESVGLRKMESNRSIYSGRTIFISLFESEIVSDHEIDALARGALVVAPRSVARTKESALFYEAMSTYKNNDPASLTRTLLGVISRQSELFSILKKHHKEVLFFHGIDNYIDINVSNFISVLRARRRMSKRKN